MTTQIANLTDAHEDDTSRVPTPIASSHTPRFSETCTVAPLKDSHESIISSDDGESLSSSLLTTLDPSVDLPADASQSVVPDPVNTQFLLPLATPSSSRSQSFYATSDSYPTLGSIDLSSLPPDLASAEIAIAPDGSFVETSSGAAARELKRMYDQQYGVGKEVRSPYAITAFVNQHGKQMYRLGTRELSAPAAVAGDADIAPRAKSQGVSNPPRDSLASHIPKTKRGSRMSPPIPPPPVEDGNRSPPMRKLRKTRSIPNMAGMEASGDPANQSQASNGRPHAHSVSSADAFRASAIVAELGRQSVQPDILSSVLSWHTTPASPLSSRSAIPLNRMNSKSSTELIANPFGPGVHFDSPGWRSSTTYLTTPHVLREMQSFESGLTARADPSPRSSRIGKLRMRPSDEFETVPEQSALHSTEEPPQPRLSEPTTDPSNVSKYSTDLFEVLQSYRGLPALDKISPLSPETTIKLSLKTDETAAPRDDPRFVIWGEVEIEPDEQEDTDASRASNTDLSSSHSGVSRRKSAKRHTVAVPENPYVRVTSGEGPKKVLIAATIERWIAQLTSELNYDELLIFFLTYRTYISADDLGHLLICRFHWALKVPNSTHDEMVQRIVRVRTFIAIRYWLLTFFAVDFVPNRELRLLFATWLNRLPKDPIIERHKDAMNLVRKLRKVVMDCKDAHTRKGRFPRPSTEKSPSSQNYTLPALGDLSDGHFAESLRKAVTQEDDTDIDLDFDDVGIFGQGFRVNPDSSVKNPTSSVDLALMRQPLLLAFLQHGKQSVPAATPTTRDLTLPVPHSTISRVIVNTMGRLGRWKRVLNARSQTRAPLGGCVDGSGFDAEGYAYQVGPNKVILPPGVDHYFKGLDVQSFHSGTASIDLDSVHLVIHKLRRFLALIRRPPKILDAQALLQRQTPICPQRHRHYHMGPTTATSFSDRLSAGSSSSRRRWPLDVVSIDDLDLSDLSSEEDVELSHPPGLKKLPRRLPNRRDFEFVRHSIDSVSSMGIQTHRSVMSAGSSSVMSSGSASAVELGGAIHQWQVNASLIPLVMMARRITLRRLYDVLKARSAKISSGEKQSKVDGWVQSIRERMAHGTYGNERPRYSSDDEEDYGEVRDPAESSFSQSSISSRSSVKSAISPQSATSPPTDEPITPDIRPSPLSQEAKSHNEDSVIPPEILSSRISTSRPSTSAGPIPQNPMQAHSFAPSAGRFFRKGHKSFVDAHSSAELVQHFCMIDRELFLNLDFEELISHDWTAPAETLNIMDWGEFLKDRARAKLDGRPLAGALSVIRARFNLVANWVISEIVMTHPGDRSKIIAKFIRVAFKAFNLKNYSLLVAIIAGLKSDWVVKATKQALNRVGMWESRMLSDLIVWTTSAGNFKFIRSAVEKQTKEKPLSGDASNISTDGQSSTTRSRAASEGKQPLAPISCVPFFGVYLSLFIRYSALPDLIDPTAPNEPVIIDPISNSFESPAHPEVFSTLAPLPPTVQLEPLINVHKQRLIADVVKSLVAGQHLAAKVQYTVDKKLFQKCLKLRAVQPETLSRALATYVGDR
ncbi:ras GEF [Cristinia sonorae]|uniref:Ras GEF n=1 Tax=Cristinia sonorae TaxID=1940300 RepID=A0A8K0UHP2_9AGAR|nr:ras GEF [Cristinia sonorae]